MNKFINRVIVVLIILFFITTSAVDDSLSLYSTTHGFSSGNISSATKEPGETSSPSVGTKPDETNKPVGGNYEDPFYKVAVGEGNSVQQKEDGSFVMKGNADAFIPVSKKCNIEDGYTFNVSVTTSEKDDFFGMGFYFYGFSNPHNSTVDGLSLQLTTKPLINSEFLFINKSYTSLEEDDDLSDGNDSIIFVKDDFWRYDKVIDHTTGFPQIKNKLSSADKYDGYTLHFKIAVKQCEDNPSKIKIQATINDYCDDNFTIITDKISATDPLSELSLGVKSFYTEGKYFHFSNIEITEHETFVPWRFQSELK